MTGTAISRDVSAGRCTATAVVTACLETIERFDPAIHAWAHVAPERARSAAAAIDRACRDGRALGLLAGVPVGVKDIFNTFDMPTCMAS